MKKEFKNRIPFYIYLILLAGYIVFLLFNSSQMVKHAEVEDTQMIFYTSLRILVGAAFIIFIYFLSKFKLNVWLMITAGIIARILFIPTSPVMEDDYNRYLWDGAVTANGINPYQYSPEEIESIAEEKDRTELIKLAEEGEEYYKNINHPQIRTIYPPPAQAVFAALYFIAPFSLTAWKITLLLFDLLTLVLLLQLLKINGFEFKYALIYWLNPIVLHEFFNAAHMDILIFPFLLTAILFYYKKKTNIALVFSAAAASIKLWPAILIPLIFRNSITNIKKYLTELLPALLIIAIMFLPVFLTTLDESLGFIKYASSWTNNDALFKVWHFLILSLNELLSLQMKCTLCFARWLTVILYLGMALFVLRKRISGNYDFNKKALLLAALFYLISPTQFPWYYTWILPLLVFYPMFSLVIYAAVLPLYQLNYLSPYFVWVQHMPILILFIFELRGKIWNSWKTVNKFS